MDFKMRNVLIAFEGALEELDELGRQPSRLEQARLVNALCSLATGDYSEAAARIFEFNRSIRRRPSGGAPDARSPVTKEQLRRGLTHVRIHH
jgi:hypothetical protein